MDTDGAAHALARISADLTESTNVAGGLVALLRSGNSFIDTAAAGILVENGHGDLELLSASSHEASELELLQSQLDEGPCVDAHHTAGPVQVAGARACIDRWPYFGERMHRAGFGAVHASPLKWQGSVIGAMGMFRRSERDFGPDEQVFAQAFADLATVMIVISGEVPADELRRRLDESLDDRITVEQAKGVLAETHGISMSAAYDLLVEDSTKQRQPLTVWARTVVLGVQGGRHTI